MSEYAVDHVVVRPPSGTLQLRREVAFAILAIGTLAWLLASILLFTRARDESAQIVQQALGQASSLSFRFDQEVTAINFLLKGLSKSPALVSGDLKGLYDQMKTTDVPDGTWLLYQDLERQLVNTRFPFGTELPRHTSIPHYKEILERIRDRRWTVSERKKGPATGNSVIGLNLRLDDASGRMSHILTAIVSEERLARLLGDQKVPADWVKGLYDRLLQPIVTATGQSSRPGIPAPAGLGDQIGSLSANDSRERTYTGRNAEGTPVLVAYRRSDATNWTSVVEIPLASVNAPIHSALWQAGGLGIFLLLTSGIATFFAARKMEKPLTALEKIVKSSNEQINELSTQLLALQEEERQRIARELHDSTAQHLVAVSIGLSHLGRRPGRGETESQLIEQIDGMVDKALKELRIFTYLLHPPDLERDGLQATLRDFTDGFARRTGLAAHIRIPEEVDALPGEIQWTILRVVQEALANVHRHAKASGIVVNIRIGANRLVMQIRDDGQGMRIAETRDAKIRFGVGVPGMRARLKQFGGELRLRSGKNGTTVVATVPLSRIGRASLHAGRVAEALLPLAARARPGALR